MRADGVTMHDLLMKQNTICIVDSNAINDVCIEQGNLLGWCRKDKDCQNSEFKVQTTRMCKSVNFTDPAFTLTLPRGHTTIYI